MITSSLRLFDVARPALVVVDRVDGEADDLDTAALELGLDRRHVAELGGAHRGEQAADQQEYEHAADDHTTDPPPQSGAVGYGDGTMRMYGSGWALTPSG